jgi:hypothetical protein
VIKNTNPYTLVFGKTPAQSISRFAEMEEVLSTFENNPPNQQIYMIGGMRGSGKTVFMTEISHELRSRKDWETIELTTSQDMLSALAQALYNENRFVKILKQGAGLSVIGFGVQLNGITEISNPQIAIKEALSKMKKQGKKLLVCIDEVVSNDYMKEFAGIFQILIREDLPLFLLITGLYENIRDLREEKNLTFLYRAPEIRLKPLNLGAVSDNYEKNLSVTHDAAAKMAALTKGYSFAFQVLGYFTFRHEGDYEAAIPEYRQYLEEYVYEKIWTELSGGDKKLLRAIAASKEGKTKEVREISGLKNNEYTPYRDRLIKKMIVNGDEYGTLKITLPLFDEFVLRMM